MTKPQRVLTAAACTLTAVSLGIVARLPALDHRAPVTNRVVVSQLLHRRSIQRFEQTLDRRLAMSPDELRVLEN